MMTESIFPKFDVDVPMPGGTAVPMANMMMCLECEHFFDPSDKRAFVSFPYAECPLCNTLRHNSMTAFAVWNGCQGIFADGLRGTFAEAEQVLSGELDGVGTCVAPVLVIVAPDDVSFRFRAFPKHGRFVDEAERDRLWKEECAARQSAP